VENVAGDGSCLCRRLIVVFDIVLNNMQPCINTVEDCKMYNIVEVIVAGGSFGMDRRMAVREVMLYQSVM
jgi:hypothetical protein